MRAKLRQFGYSPFRSFQDLEETINHNFMIHFRRVLRKVLDFLLHGSNRNMQALYNCFTQLWSPESGFCCGCLVFLLGNVAQDDSRAMFDQQRNCIVVSRWTQCKAWVDVAAIPFEYVVSFAHGSLPMSVWCGYPANNTLEHFAECQFQFRKILFEHCPMFRTEARQGGSQSIELKTAIFDGYAVARKNRTICM